MDRRASGQEKKYFVIRVTRACFEDQGIWCMFSRTVKTFCVVIVLNVTKRRQQYSRTEGRG
jgi:hypothetical protein